MQTKKSSDDLPSYQCYQLPKPPVTGTARLLILQYSECSSIGSQSDVKRRHDYSCINLPGLPIANVDLEGYNQSLTAAAAQFLTDLLNQSEFKGWEFYSAAPTRSTLGQSTNCPNPCSLYQAKVIITKAKA